ncbi:MULTISPECIES: hypothetical protein [unclassified Janthinobacterium]|uniref:hypothetical protein n=1 Tax=unclassified Janthinobacterium TaxID=2610881 RepID=UPI00161D7922|nr:MULTISPECIES: hypothetical protein [unclassified Janthinobacterium]MBB5369057.1 hypothetical protein [Janthinobacterium sp. K2C7]MBB5381406.1 hypothetical protein [Janthinobacterium sp. K2Li3]MBB5387440.1 hypothetical protein [Janthinobacterium sp. K2E3]
MELQDYGDSIYLNEYDYWGGGPFANVALAIAHANHVGGSVLVAGASEAQQVTALVVAPPAVVRPIDHDKPWFRARGGNTVFLPWWGLRYDARPGSQGYSRWCRRVRMVYPSTMVPAR